MCCKFAALVTKLVKHVEQEASKLGETDARYPLYFHSNRALKQWLVAGLPRDREVVQRVTNLPLQTFN